MPANKTNYIVLYTNDSQIYGSSSRAIALSSEPPQGSSLDEKRIFFITYQPDNEVISVHPIPLDEIRNAEIKLKGSTKTALMKEIEETPDD